MGDGVTTAGTDDDFYLVGRALFLDRAAVAAADKLRSEGIPSILLKGAAIATWLYDDGHVRPYGDVDLLVSPSQFERATEVLAELGYAHPLAGAHPAEVSTRERDLLGPGHVWIDLHLGLLGVTVSTQECWDILSRRTVDFPLAGGELQVLDLGARTMHLALHAAQNGPVDVKALGDLGRGLAKVDKAHWQEAATLAEKLGATEAFAAGLRLLPEGQRLADGLALPSRMTVELAIRTRSAPQEAIFFERLCETAGIGRKLALIARKLFPTTAHLRASAPAPPRGRLGLVWARARHPFLVAWRFGPAYFVWLRARRETKVAGGNASPLVADDIGPNR